MTLDQIKDRIFPYETEYLRQKGRIATNIMGDEYTEYFIMAREVCDRVCHCADCTEEDKEMCDGVNTGRLCEQDEGRLTTPPPPTQGYY